MATKRILLLGITTLALVLRVYRVGAVPPGLSWDEASLGYNAWSIAITLRDEHNRFLPIDAFAAFGDYKPPVYIYAAVPLVRILGPTPLAIRLPSALAGTAAVFLTYVLTKNLIMLGVGKFREKAETIALTATFLMAVSPWHLQLSRAAIEANLASTLIIAGATLLILSLKRRSLLPLAAVFFGLSLYTFNSARVFSPLLVAGAGIIFAKAWLKEKKWVLVAVGLGLVLLLPLIPFLRSPLSRLRFNEVNIFSELALVQTANQRIELDGWRWWAKAIHNRRIGYLRSFLNHYFDHFSGEFLFARGDENPKLSVTKMGELYLVELPFLLYGVYLLLKNRSRSSWFILFWLLTAPIPAATARETPHALRTLVFLPMFPVITAIGVAEVWFQKPKVVAVALVLVLVQFGFYLDYYYRFYPVEFSADWSYGYRPMVKTVLGRQEKYDQIMVSNVYGRPYIFFLLYGRIRPEIFWKDGLVETDVFGFKKVTRLGKFRFGELNYQPGLGRQTLWVGRPEEFPPETQPIQEIKFLNQETAFWLVEG